MNQGGDKMKFTLRQARTFAGITQSEMAEKLGMTEKTYIQYEKYRRIFRMDDAYKFSEIVGIDLDKIIFFDKELRINRSKEAI
ncbi:helix-turn-helix transcriptional regulator [Parvimonas micra]|uniref:DNA-binding helix-turn-helix protein n=3 Tax=Peptoniphilaceae TaxID=1570339 RepID=A8SI84_9FIRM|nr:helix-turn-helix transcriptional regulator [Parvimonas micra]EDP24817.1 DNA-binding helix-turn-helix protein [Parvimonas micra ATCC 33270]